MRLWEKISFWIGENALTHSLPLVFFFALHSFSPLPPSSFLLPPPSSLLSPPSSLLLPPATSLCSLQVQDSLAGVLAAHTASKQETIAAWDGEKRKITK